MIRKTQHKLDTQWYLYNIFSISLDCPFCRQYVYSGSILQFTLVQFWWYNVCTRSQQRSFVRFEHIIAFWQIPSDGTRTAILYWAKHSFD